MARKSAAAETAIVYDPKKQREEIIIRTNESLEMTGAYYLQLILATIIVTLGLHINSPAVVIGGMLIAPLFWPILGFTIGIITTREKLLNKSVYNLFVSIVIVLVISYFLSLLVPNRQLNDEIYSRINPTLIDMFIALAAAVMGVLAVYNEKISQTAAGVAISIALLPPLATAGIGIAFADLTMFYRALLLFGANIGAIVFAGAVTLYLLKFRPHFRREKKRMMYGLLFSGLFLLIVAVPLSIFLRNSLQQNQVRNKIEAVLLTEALELNEQAVVDEISVGFPGKESIEVEATIYLPENTYLTVENENSLTQALTEAVNRSVSLKLNLINTLYLRRQEDNQRNDFRELLTNILTTEVNEIDPEAVIEDINILLPDNENGQVIKIYLLLRDNDDNLIDLAARDRIVEKLAAVSRQEVVLDIEFIPITSLRDDSGLQRQILLREKIGQYFRGLDSRTRVYNYYIDRETEDIVNLSVIMIVPRDFRFGEEERAELEADLGSVQQKEVIINVNFIQTRSFDELDETFPTSESTESELDIG